MCASRPEAPETWDAQDLEVATGWSPPRRLVERIHPLLSFTQPHLIVPDSTRLDIQGASLRAGVCLFRVSLPPNSPTAHRKVPAEEAPLRTRFDTGGTNLGSAVAIYAAGGKAGFHSAGIGALYCKLPGADSGRL